MIFTEDVFEIEDALDQLSDKLISSKTMLAHCQNKVQILETPATIAREITFNEAKEAFEKIEAYGDFAPDFKEKRRELRQAKRELDLDELIGNYRATEFELQNMLDRIVYEMAAVVSPDIKIDAGNPFFEFASKGCGGNCHAG